MPIIGCFCFLLFPSSFSPLQDSIVDLALALGLPHDQLTIGVPAHGILYKLANVSQTTPGSPAIPWNYNDAIISHTKVRACNSVATDSWCISSLTVAVTVKEKLLQLMDDEKRMTK